MRRNGRNRIHDSLKVLVVEDNLGLRRLIEKRLEREEFNVEVVENGKETVARLKANPETILLLDYKLPDMNGSELIEKLNDEQINVPFVVMTGHGDERTAVEMMKLGARDYLVKDHSLLEVLPQVMEQVYAQVTMERKLSEVRKALHESEERFKLLFNRGTDAIFVMDIDSGLPGHFIEVNDVACTRLGYTREELLRQPWNRIEIMDDLEAARMVKERLTSHKHILYEAYHIAKTGERISVENNAHLIDLGGKNAILCISRDITQRKHLEDQLRQAQKMEAIGKLAGGVAHDFNNLLTAIMGYSDLLLVKMGQQNPYREVIFEIKKAGERAASLTQQLLAFSRKQILKPRTVDLNRVVNGMGKMLKRIIGEDIKLVTNLEEKLRKIKADPGQVEQIILNLSVNAVDAMLSGGKLTISTHNKHIDDAGKQSLTPGPAAPGEFACLEISDTGHGIDETIIPNIFEPFFTTKKSGTGLGLSVVYGIIKQHTGWIDVKSDPEAGTTFSIYFPALLEDTEEGVEQETSLNNLTGKGERVLMVEDEVGVLNVAARALRDYGYEVVEAVTAEQGYDIFVKENGNFDLVVSDIVLPDENGVEMADKIRAIKTGMKILLTSGYADQRAHRAEVVKKGIPFLQKPYSLSDLLKHVRCILDDGDLQ
jgi:PAS domain S-box-containing protein